MSLRERKKAATRSALSAAALRLTVERGLDQVRVEDIAAEADVSPRTFNNYFPSKEAAIVGGGAAQLDRISAALDARPAKEPLWTAVSHAIVESYHEPDRAWIAKVRLLKTEPALLAESLKSDRAGERELAEHIASRIGADVKHDLYPRLAAAAVFAAVHAALDFWLDAPVTTTLKSSLTEALRQIADGLPVPAAGSKRRPILPGAK